MPQSNIIEYTTRKICIRSIYKHYPYIPGDEIVKKGVWYDCKVIHFMDDSKFKIKVSQNGNPYITISLKVYEDNFMSAKEYRDFNIEKLFKSYHL